MELTSTPTQYELLKSEEGLLLELLDDIHPDAVIERLSLEARLENVRECLGNLDE